MKFFITTIVLLAALAGLGYAWFWYNGGVTHRDLQNDVKCESHEIQARIDNRFSKTMKKLEALEQKLDGVDMKLDKILEIANRPAVDNMEIVK